MADLTVLKDSGMNIDGLSDDERKALERLDASEVQALAAIRNKLNEGDEVEGFAVKRAADGYVVW